MWLDWNLRQTLEASPTAAEEGVANGLTCTTVLTWVGNTCCYLHLTPPSSVLGATAAREPWQTDREEGENKIGIYYTFRAVTGLFTALLD